MEDPGAMIFAAATESADRGFDSSIVSGLNMYVPMYMYMYMYMYTASAMCAVVNLGKRDGKNVSEK
jgi:hypothetical protein